MENTVRIDNKLADGSELILWERPQIFSKTYYVDCNNNNANDEGFGTEENPFKTIGKAAEILKAGERVIIRGGTYRESIHPKNGGGSPETMICYEAAENETVVVKGSIVVEKGWKQSENWKLEIGQNIKPSIWELKLEGKIFEGYNPFGMVNLLGDYHCLSFKKFPYDTSLLRRGMVFVDGKPLKQVKLYSELGENEGAFWVEHNGLKVHVRFPSDAKPEQHFIEITTKEQVFAPDELGLGYIRVKGITFEHAANGNPVPQKGLVSTSRGHHWIIEDCTIQWANSVGLDAGNQDWNASIPNGEFSHHIIRRNIIKHCGVCGLAACSAENMLVEDNLIEYIGAQRAYYAWESAGIKFHHAVNLLYRRNIMRHIEFCAGIWMDCGNKNCRMTGNIFADMPETTCAVYFEATRFMNMVDNNIIWGIGKELLKQKNNSDFSSGWHDMDKETYGCGILSQGSDEMIVVNNLIGDCIHSGFHADTFPYRLVDGRGGTARDNQLFNNIFYRCGEAAIDFANEKNYAEGNLYIKMNPKGGYLRILNPDPAVWLNIDAWQKFYGWDKKGAVLDAQIDFDSESLMLSIDMNEQLQQVSSHSVANSDYQGSMVGNERYPGPFEQIGNGNVSKFVDPRKL